MKKLTYLFLILLVTGNVYSQNDTLSIQSQSPKNHIGILISAAMSGDINNYPSPLLNYNPFFTPSIYLEYNRVLSKRIWITAGTGFFINGYNTVSYYPPSFEPSISKESNRNYNMNFSVNVKPKLILADKKLLFYVGLSAQLNLYITSLNYLKRWDNNGILRQNGSEFGAYSDATPFNFYGGIISGIGYKCNRFLFVAEPEFKVNINSYWYRHTTLFRSQTNILFIPYSLGINLIAYYNF